MAEGEAVVADIRAKGGQAVFIQADLGETGIIPSIIAQVVSAYGRLDCAFNNAGVSGGGPIETLDENIWDRIIDTNLKTAFFCLRAEAMQMKAQGSGGTILFTASVLASIGRVGTTIYSASKGGVVAMARAAAIELAPAGIRVNALSPSVTRTPMTTARITTGADGKLSHPWRSMSPLGRLAEAEEIAQAALFLMSERASYISGHTLLVDGGQSAA